MNVWSVVVLIVGVITFSVGILFKFISDNTRLEMGNCKLEIKANIKRIEILERQADVIANELSHINRKLDDLLRR